MNYLPIYVDLCMRGVGRKLPPEVHVEKHHIVPRCMGGTDYFKNICYLTVKEHWLAHCLLVQIFPSNYNLLASLDVMANSKANAPHRTALTLKAWQKRRITAGHVLRNETKKRRQQERKQLAAALKAWGGNDAAA